MSMPFGATSSHLSLEPSRINGQMQKSCRSEAGKHSSTFPEGGSSIDMPDSSDIDLVVRSSQIERQPKTQVLYALAAALRRANLAENVQIIGRAKVPIVKFVSSFGRFNVDISINQINGVSAGQIVNSYIDCLPALRPLVLVIKAFLSQRSMNEVYSGGLGSYSVICLVISFLQVSHSLTITDNSCTPNSGGKKWIP